MLKVLVVEDDDRYFEAINLGLDGRVEVLRAKTLEQGNSLFQNNPDIDLIIMDACVPGDSPNSMSLVKKIAATGYDKPIIACSGLGSYRRELVNAGATHTADKFDAAKMALNLLNL